MVAKSDLLGRVFSRLTVVSAAPTVKGRSMWQCVCQCGSVTVKSGARLVNGTTQSCGCLVPDAARARAKRDNIGGYKGYAKYKCVADYVANTTPNGACLEWNGPTYKNGYAKFGNNSRIPTNAGHRAVYFLTHGSLPPVVRHTCDNRKCINPDHLLGGTHADNMQDKVDRGRDLHLRKLTTDQVSAIRAERIAGATSPALAKKYGVSKHNILEIIHERIWKTK